MAPIRQGDVSDCPPVAIQTSDMHEDGLPKHEASRKLPGLCTEGLALLRGVDPMQTDDLLAPGVEDRERVAVRDADHAALNFPGTDRADEPDGQEQDQPR